MELAKTYSAYHRGFAVEHEPFEEHRMTAAAEKKDVRVEKDRENEKDETNEKMT